MYFYHPHSGRFEQSTRSSVRATTFAPSFRRSYDDDVLYAPYRPSVLPHYSYDTSGSEYATASDINRELIMSSAAMEDNFDISNRSRQRDRDVLSAANRAIVDTEVHSTPKGAVAAMRVTRGQSSPPVATNVARTKVHVAVARASPKLRCHVPPASFPHRRPRFPRVTVRPRYRYWFPARASGNKSYPVKMAREPSPDIEGLRRAPLSILAYLRNLELALLSNRTRTRSYVPLQTAYRKKAALLANKVEVDLPRRRTPRSSYAQARLREMRKSKHSDEVDAQPVAVAEVTSGLKAHAPVYDPAFAKPYWGDEGVRKPNIMSWKYRLDTYASPDDLIIVPRSLNAVRSQLREVHDKLDHHKQLMDRYLVADKGFSVEDSIA